MITEEAKNKILKIRQMLKENAPYVYQKFANHKINEKETPEEVKEEVNSDDCPF